MLEIRKKDQEKKDTYNIHSQKKISEKNSALLHVDSYNTPIKPKSTYATYSTELSSPCHNSPNNTFIKILDKNKNKNIKEEEGEKYLNTNKVIVFCCDKKTINREYELLLSTDDFSDKNKNRIIQLFSKKKNNNKNNFIISGKKKLLNQNT